MAIVIDVKLTDAKTDTALDRLEKAIAKLDDVVSRMNANLSQAASQTNQIAANMGRAANSAARVRAAQNTMLAVVPPPKQSWESIREGYRSGAAAGDPEAVRKFLQADRELKRMARARKLATGEGDSIQDILMRTRFANVFGMSVPMPLGRDLKALGGMAGINVGGQFAGIGAKLAPLASAIAPVVLAISAMGVTVATYTKIAQEGYKALREFNMGLNMIGGSTGEAGGAMLASRALGLSSAYASELSARIASDATARMVAGKAGVGGLQGYYGNINDSKNLSRILEYLARLPYEQARREAIGLGDPRLAEFSRMNRSVQQRLLNPSTGGLSGMDIRTGSNLAGEIAIIGEEFAELMRILSGPGTAASIPAIRALSFSLNDFNTKVAFAIQPMKNFIQMMNEQFNFIMDIIDRLTGRGNKGEDPAVKELKEINKGVKELNDGVIGGGARARNSNMGPRGGSPGVNALDEAIRRRQLGTGMI